MEAAEDEDADSYPESFSASLGFLATGFLVTEVSFFPSDSGTEFRILPLSFISLSNSSVVRDILCSNSYSLSFLLKSFKKTYVPVF